MPTEMSEDRFWSIFESVSKIPGPEVEAQEAELEQQLSSLTDEELISFQMTYDRLHTTSYRWDLWEVAFFTGGGCSDDSFTYFRNWLMGRGRTAYLAVMENPDNLADYPMGDEPDMGPQTVEWDFLPCQIWESREPSRDDDQWFELIPETDHADILREPIGQPFDEDDVEGFRARYPRLAAMYAHMLG